MDPRSFRGSIIYIYYWRYRLCAISSTASLEDVFGVLDMDDASLATVNSIDVSLASSIEIENNEAKTAVSKWPKNYNYICEAIARLLTSDEYRSSYIDRLEPLPKDIADEKSEATTGWQVSGLVTRVISFECQEQKATNTKCSRFCKRYISSSRKTRFIKESLCVMAACNLFGWMFWWRYYNDYFYYNY